MPAVAAWLALIATPAAAQLCDGSVALPTTDGRMFGHLPYGDTSPDDLVAAPPDFAINQACLIARDALPDLERLLAAARADPAVQGQLRGISCHRSLAWQRGVFCRERGTDAAVRAMSVAPPGFSEHATGYAIDFAVRPSPNCPDAEACMAATPAWRWLVANAPRFGFEQSFPGGDRQRVKWEPWHWRWVGTTATAPGAARARFRFARARRDFPADPSVDGMGVIRAVPTPPVFLDLPAWVEPKTKKRRK